MSPKAPNKNWIDCLVNYVILECRNGRVTANLCLQMFDHGRIGMATNPKAIELAKKARLNTNGVRSGRIIIRKR